MDFTSFFNYENPEGEPEAASPVFLAQLSESGWSKLLSYAQHRRFAEGETVLQAGEQSRDFYIVAKGRLEAVAQTGEGKEILLSPIEEHSIIGEQSFFDGLPRSATVRAQTDGELFRIDAAALEVMSARDPALAREVVADLARILSLRLREMTQRLLHIVR